MDEMLLIEVAKPLVGEKSPAVVKAHLQLNIGKRMDIRGEVLYYPIQSTIDVYDSVGITS